MRFRDRYAPVAAGLVLAVVGVVLLLLALVIDGERMAGLGRSFLTIGLVMAGVGWFLTRRKPDRKDPHA